MLGRHAWHGRIAFEIDDTDAATKSGWSVPRLGQGELVEDAAELAALRPSRTTDPGGLDRFYLTAYGPFCAP